MQRSSSFANIKIDFNPLQTKVGHSSIDKLPIRRTTSHKSISKISEVAQNQQKITLQSQQIKIDMLKRVNESLQRENQYLTKQLNYFTQACSSRRSSINGVPATKTNVKEKILSRIDPKIQKEIDLKNDTQSTGLFNSKFSNSGRKMDHVDDLISETYESLITRGTLPKVSAIKELCGLLIENIKENYQKLQTMVCQISKKGKQTERLPKQTIETLKLLETVTLFSKIPKHAITVLKNKQPSKQQRIEEILKEFICSTDLINLLESVIKSLLPHNKIIAYLRNSIIFCKLMKKVSKSQ